MKLASTPQRRFLLWRFLAFLGGLIGLFILGISLAVILAWRFPHPEPHRPPGPDFLLLACLLPLGFFLLSGLIGAFAFRGLVHPIADVMSAADDVARGNLKTRLPERGARPFRALARSFNNMISELERAEQQRRNMTADIAHELRNPLHILQGNLEGMLDGVYEPTVENLTATLEETRLLARLVNDLQTLSLAEAGQLPLHPSRFLAADLLSDVAASFTARAAAQNVTLTSQISDSAASAELLADYDRLDQVFSNLVMNALRHTPAGGSILLGLDSAPQGVCITVSDTGSGISPEDLPFIFDRFWKGDRARARDGAGSGLGLAIARQLIRAHGGEIEAASRPGAGTQFTVYL